MTSLLGRAVVVVSVMLLATFPAPAASPEVVWSFDTAG